MNASTHNFSVESELGDTAQGSTSWLERHSVKTKVNGAVLGAVLFLWLICGLVMGGNLYFANEGEKLRDKQSADFLLAGTQTQLSRAELALTHYLVDGDASDLADAQTAMAAARDEVSTASQLESYLPEELDARLADNLSTIDALHDRIASLASASAQLDTVSQLGEDISTSFAAIKTLSVDIHLHSEAEGGKIFSQIAETAIYFIVLIIVGPAIVLWMGRRVARDVSDNVSGIAESAQDLAKGDTDTDIPGTHREDEIGALARSLTVFRDTTRREVSVQREMAENQAQLNQAQAEAQQEKAQALQNVAREFQASIGQAVETIAAAAEELVQNANTLSEASDRAQSDLSGSVETLEETTSGVMAAAAASDEFALSISEISSQATQSATIAREAGDVAGSANGKIEELSRDAAEVGEIVELIQSIATRTNLLALNASIEAARGSEAGRGFAVVASEVKELASRTAAATDNIAQKISAIQNSTGASVDALKSVVEEISRLEASSVSIASAVDQQSVTGRELAKNIDIAARNTDRISSTMAGVEETASKAGSATKNMQSAAHELQAQAQVLKESAASFLATIDQPTQSTSERAA